MADDGLIVFPQFWELCDKYGVQLDIRYRNNFSDGLISNLANFDIKPEQTLIGEAARNQLSLGERRVARAPNGMWIKMREEVGYLIPTRDRLGQPPINGLLEKLQTGGVLYITHRIELHHVQKEYSPSVIVAGMRFAGDDFF